MIIEGMNTEFIFKEFSPLIKKLRSLKVQNDEILSDIAFTILNCRKNYRAGFVKFHSYFKICLEKNLKAKILAIETKNATEQALFGGIEYKESSGLNKTVSEVPEIIDYVLQKVSDNIIIEEYGQIGRQALNDIEDLL